MKNREQILNQITKLKNEVEMCETYMGFCNENGAAHKTYLIMIKNRKSQIDILMWVLE